MISIPKSKAKLIGLKRGEEFDVEFDRVNRTLVFIPLGQTKYTIYTGEEFDHDFSKLDTSLKIQIENEIAQLETNPYVGKPLGYKFFREKKVKNYRIYYLIYEEYVVVLVVALSDKKDQKRIINAIKHLIPFYKEEIKKMINP